MMHAALCMASILLVSMTVAGAGEADCRTILKEIVDSLPPTVRNAEIRRFYAAGDYAPVWFRDGRWADQAGAWVRALQQANSNGLSPEDYDAANLAAQFDPLRRGASARNVAQFDAALTASILHYVSDLHIGRVNPKLFHSGFDLERDQYDLPAFVRNRLMNVSDIEAALVEVEPPFPGYRRTKKALRRYLALSARDSAARIPAADRAVSPGDAYASAGALANLLREFGDLPPSTVVSQDQYQGELVEAVKRFQRRHGLDSDGRIGSATLRQLNTPIDQRIRQLAFTLERYRWVPHRFSRPPIVVNIPEFRLRAMNESYRTSLEMKVVVGGAYRHQTPVFAGELRMVVFRPYWDVPPGIQRGELVQKIAKDPDYLAHNNYEIVSPAGGVIREMNTEILAQLRAGKLRIRQRPGDENALGLVKFLFPNEYNVYMHGTPAAELFSRSRRDFSHGCIRLEKPEELAAWVLQSKGDWTPERIRAAMHGSQTITIRIERPIPVLIVYATAVVQENGEVDFFDDIYGHDAALEKL